MVEHERTGPVDLVTWSVSRISMILPAVIVVVMSTEVVMRYIFASPTLWANELSLWIAGAVDLLAGLYSMQQRSHIRITLLYDAAPVWLRHVFDLLSLACLLIFVFAVVWGGFGEAWAKLMRWETFGTAWDPPLPATIKPLILAVVTLTAIQAVSNLVLDWRRATSEHSILDEVDIDVDGIRAAEAEIDAKRDAELAAEHAAELAEKADRRTG
jgi:TRAP-type C4-dicarboxylate transport system permease small subunit